MRLMIIFLSLAMLIAHIQTTKSFAQTASNVATPSDAAPVAKPSTDLKVGSLDTILIGRLQVQPSVMDLAKKNSNELALSRITESLDTQLISALNSTRSFTIVERKRKEDLELEQAFAHVAVDANDKNAAQALKFSGAKYAFLPQVDGFDDHTSTVEFSNVNKSASYREVTLSVIVQIIDTTTGVVLPDSPSVQLNSKDIPNAGSGDALYVSMAKEMAEKLSRQAVSLLRPPKVLAVTGKQVLINHGIGEGFTPDTPVEFYAAQDIVDPDTGQSYRNEVPVGKGKIARGDAKQSFAMIEGDDLGITKGCVVRVSITKKTANNRKEITPVSNDKKMDVEETKKDREGNW